MFCKSYPSYLLIKAIVLFIFTLLLIQSSILNIIYLTFVTFYVSFSLFTLPIIIVLLYLLLLYLYLYLYYYSFYSLYSISNYLIEVSTYLIIPLFSCIKLYCFSLDVIHSLGFYSFGFKIDAIPGRINFVSTLRSLVKGLNRGFCYELCGEQHSAMLNSWILN